MLPKLSVLMSVLLISPAWAQDSANARVSLAIPKLVKISNLQDIALGEWSGSGDLQSEQQLCVWSSTDSYSLSGNSDNGEAGQFRLAGPDTQTVDYQVYWDDGEGFRQLRNGETLTGLVGATEHNCAEENSPRPGLRVHVDGEILANAAFGDYQDRLSLTVIAE